MERPESFRPLAEEAEKQKYEAILASEGLGLVSDDAERIDEDIDQNIVFLRNELTRHYLERGDTFYGAHLKAVAHLKSKAQALGVDSQYDRRDH